MTTTRRRVEQQESAPAALPLEASKRLLKDYYAGKRLESPVGGFLELLALRPGPDGSAIAWFECSASSLRYELVIPKATRTEKKKIKDQLARGLDPDCPRHGPGYRLTRAGRDLVCSLCGISYGKG